MSTQSNRARLKDCLPSDKRFGKLTAIIAHYRTNYQDDADRELGFFRDQPSLEKAINFAGLARDPHGKRFNHQRRIPASVLRKSEQKLQNVYNKLLTANSFETVHAVVETAIGSIRGIGELMIYDTALRLAAWKKLEPKSVFLHAGTRVGARAMGLPSAVKHVELSDFPKTFRSLRAHEIEDVLCIYKRQLQKLYSERGAI